MKKFVLATCAAAVVLSGCAGGMSDTQRNTGIGAGIGALGGAAIGSATGGNRGAIGTGAVVGAAAGALGGYLWSQRMENQKRQMEAATQGTGVDVVQTPNNELKLQDPERHLLRHRPCRHQAELRAGPGPVRQRPAQQPERRSAHHRPHRQHRLRRHQQPAVDRPRRQHARLPGVARCGYTRIAVNGAGSREPIADNNSDAGRASNRRVEIYAANAHRAADLAP
jgi:hypothetical protein